ncbi:ATP-binding cassette domain-containing protein [Georgenia muralis]|uniref:ABC-2 type transport system ATP-binding protein n=1 Tax=Georgenia muralis TaxID=154117 RepID=A0A3N5A6B5_9MICO|nr:ATP-binding cassette domain-containing protein [Georgenia muralis]RPF28935.1 ABC-2 type transport system ATP-binding protein [Georgenia muralis]
MPTPTSPAIEALGLRKSFGEQLVLDGIDLVVPAGTVLALLGPNGAGKTTTVHILSTLLSRDAGTVRVAGHDLDDDPDGIRAAIGLTGQFSAVDALLTGGENLHLMADLHHLPRAEGRRRSADLLARFDLTESARKPASTYSGGMLRKLDLAMTLVGEPRVVFLDEPTTGLDPRSRHAMWDVVRSLVADGVTILLTTQHLEEADQLADRVAVLDAGRIVAHGTPAELKRLVPGGSVRLHLADRPTLATAAAAFPDGVADVEALTVSLARTPDLESLRVVLDEAERAGVVADRIEVASPGLDDVFLALTGHTTPTPTREVAP